MGDVLVESIIATEDTEMTTAITPAEQRVLLRDIPWELYESLLIQHQDKSIPRFTYDQGLLEIMSPSSEHEKMPRLITVIVSTWAEEIGIELIDYGSTTFRRKDLERGFEPDNCFYIRSIEQLTDDSNIDLKKDPPPDIVVEIDITNSSINKFPIFAQICVPEVWRYSKVMTFFKLEAGNYLKVEKSSFLPGLTAKLLTEFIKQDKPGKRIELLKRVRELARKNR